MEQVFVVDTSSLIHSPNALYSFGGNTLVIPITTYEELDDINHKRRDAASANARMIIRTIDRLQEEQQSDTVTLDNGTTIVISDNCEYMMPRGYDPEKADNQILNTALWYKKQGYNITLVSNDGHMRTKARKLKLKAMSLEEDRVHVRIDSVYAGWEDYEVSSERVDRFYADKELSTRKEFLPNEFVVLRDSIDPKHSAIGRYDYLRKTINPLKFEGTAPWGIRALNAQQKFALDLLMDPTVQIVSLIGKAGTGKSLISIAAGGQQVEDGLYDKMIIYKPLIPVGRDVGFLPGELEDKIGPYMGSVYDSLEFILGKATDKMPGNGNKGKSFNKNDQTNDKIDYLIDSGMLELAALTFIRGRSLPKLFILVDEAQNLTPHEVKTIATRIGEDAKLVLVGDPYQIDHPYLDSQSNGLVYLTERLKGRPEFGTVTLRKPERSSIAEMCAELL